jgi:hypothetical protein
LSIERAFAGSSSEGAWDMADPSNNFFDVNVRVEQP